MTEYKINKVGEFFELTIQDKNEKNIYLIKLENIFEIHLCDEDLEINFKYKVGKSYEHLYLGFENKEKLYKVYSKIKELLD